MLKNRSLIGGFVLGVLVALVTSQALSQDQGKMPSPEEMQKMMAQWMATMSPGEHHKRLEASIGTWDTVTRIWEQGPDAPPTETKGVSERRWVLGGRFVMEEFKSQFQLPDMATGQPKSIPWEGMGLTGYDNNRNLYVGCWADTMGTQLLTMKGSMSPDGKTFTTYGEMDEPMLGVVGRMVKFQTKVVDQDNAVFSIYDLHAGDNYKVAEVTYKRQKK